MDKHSVELLLTAMRNLLMLSDREHNMPEGLRREMCKDTARLIAVFAQQHDLANEIDEKLIKHMENEEVRHEH